MCGPRWLFLALVIVSLPRLAAADVILGPVVNDANGHTYYLLQATVWDELGFTNAEAEAQSLGGHLATVSDAAEDAWIFSTFSPHVGSPGVIGIGLNDFANEGQFEWTSGEPLAYTNWDQSPGSGFGPQPDGGPDDIVGIVNGIFTSGRWHDFNTDPTDAVPSASVFGLVEVAAVPEPSAVFAPCLWLAVVSRRGNRRTGAC